jgi:UDP-galactopyranose mutase
LPYIIIKIRDKDDTQKLYEQVYSRTGKDYTVEQWSVFDGLPPELRERVLKALLTKANELDEKEEKRRKPFKPHVVDMTPL